MNALTTAPSGGEAALREAAAQLCERAGATVHWEAFEDEEHATRLRVCEERRRQWGSDDGCDHDGMCAECGQDMAEHHETDASKAVRKVCRKLAAAIRALALPAPAPDGRGGEVVQPLKVIEAAEVPRRKGDIAVTLEKPDGNCIIVYAESYDDVDALQAALAPSSEERR
ncbi:hypothetical protein [Roseomonas xinghualingensis]|uniref:hypothetical protein n=1 Tax=Roseomonas xinghualingensis TaxID=2986475 RepID=UPI0021F10494|nr:hypothetical protein [Roseomonas sp. SXEYE001]MCV4207534.1 hypothetical protein [Roseomonas sp. SXEYE001]